MNGNEIRQARERAGLTQDELGERIGVSGRTVGNWERDFSIPRNRLAKVEQVLNVREYLGQENRLHEVSDATLLAEIARRFDEGRTRKGKGEGHEQRPTSMSEAEGNSATEERRTAVDFIAGKQRLRADPAPDDEGFDEFIEQQAAKRGVNRGKQAKREQDDNAEN